MVEEFVQPVLQDRALENDWFHQYGATAHSARISLRYFEANLSCLVDFFAR